MEISFLPASHIRSKSLHYVRHFTYIRDSFWVLVMSILFADLSIGILDSGSISKIRVVYVCSMDLLAPRLFIHSGMTFHPVHIVPIHLLSPKVLTKFQLSKGTQVLRKQEMSMIVLCRAHTINHSGELCMNTKIPDQAVFQYKGAFPAQPHTEKSTYWRIWLHHLWLKPSQEQ